MANNLLNQICEPCTVEEEKGLSEKLPETLCDCTAVIQTEILPTTTRKRITITEETDCFSEIIRMIATSKVCGPVDFCP